MSASLPPNGTRRWLEVLFPMLQAASPLTVIVMIVLGYLAFGHLSRQITQERERAHHLAQLLLEETRAHRELARICNGEDR